MRHGKRSQRLSRPRAQRDALVAHLVSNLVVRDQIQTTHARAKEASRLADRLVTLGKNGSIHARRRAFRILQDQGQVKRLFAEIAPRFLDCAGGYTRVVRLRTRRGDGAQLAVLSFSRLPAVRSAQVSPPSGPKAPKAPEPSAPGPKPATPTPKKSARLFEGLRALWPRKKKDPHAP